MAAPGTKKYKAAQRGFYFFVPRSGWGIGLPCVSRPGGLALLRLCAAVAACQSSAPGTIFFSISAYLVPCCRHPLGRVQSYTPSLLPRQNTTYARTTSKKLAAFIFCHHRAVVGLVALRYSPCRACVTQALRRFAACQSPLRVPLFFLLSLYSSILHNFSTGKVQMLPQTCHKVFYLKLPLAQELKKASILV